MKAIQVPPAPTWTPVLCAGPNDPAPVLKIIRDQRRAAQRLREAEAAARALIAKAEEDERRRQGKADAALWNAYLGRGGATPTRANAGDREN